MPLVWMATLAARMVGMRDPVFNLPAARVVGMRDPVFNLPAAGAVGVRGSVSNLPAVAVLDPGLCLCSVAPLRLCVAITPNVPVLARWRT